jgi:transcriptional regulator with XRE-family HTH domain
MPKALIQNSLLEYRKNAGLTQMVVARKLGFTTAERISAWEKGKGAPGIFNLLKLAIVYDTLPHVLYENLFEELKSKLVVNPQEV